MFSTKQEARPCPECEGTVAAGEGGSSCPRTWMRADQGKSGSPAKAGNHGLTAL